MGDHKNTIIAIVLSLLVVVGWQYFVGYPQMEKQREQALIKQQEQAQTQPGATQPNPAQPGATPGPSGAGTPPPVPGTAAPAVATASRNAVIAASPRIAISTPTLRGSIDLKGGRIDDLALERYRETIDPNSPAIVLFSPSGAPEAFYAEFGWVAAAGSTAAMPGRSIPGRVRSLIALAATAAPVCPALTTASALSYFTRSTARLIDESFFRRTAVQARSLISTT